MPRDPQLHNNILFYSHYKYIIKMSNQVTNICKMAPKSKLIQYILQ